MVQKIKETIVPHGSTLTAPNTTEKAGQIA